MSGAQFSFKRHKCRDCDKIAFGKSKLCLDCKVGKIYNWNDNGKRKRDE